MQRLPFAPADVLRADRSDVDPVELRIEAQFGHRCHHRIDADLPRRIAALQRGTRASRNRPAGGEHSDPWLCHGPRVSGN
jgi:hypothetical protein